MTNIEIIKAIAKLHGVKNLGQSKEDLVRAIQKKEGFQPCFATKGLECPQYDCLWRQDCVHRPFMFKVKD